MYYTYILRSEKDKGYYYGSTSDLSRRVKEHNDGRVKSTKFRGPWQLHYFEEFLDRGRARKREMYFKKTIGLQVA